MAHLVSPGADFLSTVRILDVMTTKTLITLHPNDSISTALETLARNNITSAPVYDKDMGTYLGFVDVLDLAVFVCSVFAETYRKHPHLYSPKELDTRFCLPVSQVINASHRDPFYPVEASQSLSFLIGNFLTHGVHRIPVKENERIIGLVSQSDVIRFLQKNYQQHFPMLMLETVGMLGLDKREVVSVQNNEPLMKAFTTLLTHKISGVAVVDMQSGELVNNISASDLKGITQSGFFKLEMPIHQIFLYSEKLAPVTCSSATTFDKVLDTFAVSGVHRIFVLDAHRKPTGVITLTDVLKLFTPPVLQST